MIIIILHHHISKDREGSYYTIPFDVPDNVEKITVSYDYFRKGQGFLADLKPSNTVDIGLEDENGNFLGWSGSAHKSVSVGEYDSSAGYLCRPVKSGKWKILVGAYHIMPDGVDVTYNIDFKFKGERLLFGDLHIHTTASDGSMSAYEVGALAKNNGLDFIALANHNNFSENFFLPHIDGLTFIPAVEWTHYKGHMNFFGVKNPFENSFVANTKEEMQKLISNARSKGAVISVNHPKCRFCPYLWEDENAFDMVEIWNGPMRKTNTDGIKWWTHMLCKGRKLPAVGGSDFHKPKGLVKLGNPVTGVYSKSPAPEDILNALRNGKAFVSENVDGVRLNLKYGNYSMGDTARFDSNIPLVAQSNSDSLTLVTDKGEKIIKLTQGKAEVNIEKVKFAYVKAEKGFGKIKKITALSNPIYFE
ncbi:MAG: CehA/McbA family metallohydrolase [Eubacterium sp.]